MSHHTALLLTSLAIFSLVPSSSSAQTMEQTLKDQTWRSLGPTATGGRIVDIAVHPNDPASIYAASASGGLWKTINNGTTWTCVFEREGTISIGDIAIDPRQPDTIWVGTGEANNQRSSMWGDGIYKSTDGGKTWQNMGLRETHHIGRIVVHPNDSNVVYVAALGHLYSANKERGVFKTSDGGKTWQHVLYLSNQVGAADLVIDRRNPQTLYAATYERLRRAWNFDGAGPGSGIYKSTNGGASWQRLTGGLPVGEIGRIGLAIYDRNPDILYATVSNQNPVPTPVVAASRLLALGIEFQGGKCVVKTAARNGLAARRGIKAGDELILLAGAAVRNQAEFDAVMAQLKASDTLTLTYKRAAKLQTISITIPQQGQRQVGGEVYRTDDGGQSWVKQNKDPVGGTPAYYYGQIRVDPNDDKQVYVLSIPMYKSSDGGKTWSSRGAPSVHVDHHALWINPNNSKHMLLGNDGGFHISYDQGLTWDYVFNLPLAQFYAVGVDMQQPYHVYGGLQDNGSFAGPSRSRNPRGISRFDWHKVGGGDGFYVQVHRKKPHLIITESQFGVISRWDRRSGLRKSIRPPQKSGERHRYNWNSPILISHHNDDTIYFAAQKLFKSTDFGDNWQTISPDLTTANAARITGNVPHCTITTIAESPLDQKVLLVGTDDGNVQWSNDAGKTWTNMADRFPLRPQGWWCTRVELSHHRKGVAYACFSGYREDDFRPFVFATDDAGKTWGYIGHTLPVGPINVVKEDPRNGDVLYAGSDFAVHVSLDRGNRWTPLGSGLPRVPVHDLLIHPRDRDIVIGTHGRGIFTMDVSPVQEMTSQVLGKDIHLFEIENATQWRFSVTQSLWGDRKVLTPNPPYGAVVHYYLKKDLDAKSLSLRIVDKDNKPIADVPVQPKAGLHQVTWALRTRPKGQRRLTPVPSGTYTAILKHGNAEQRRTFEVKADPLGK